MLRALALAAALAGPAAAGPALVGPGEDFGFEPPKVLTFAHGTHPGQMLAADVTGDGLPDLVVASETQGLIVVRNHEGSFMFGAAIPTALPAPVDRWRAGDMNGDGAADLVVLPREDNRVRVLLSDGDSGFTPGGQLVFPAPGFFFRDFELLDANEDGHLDVMLFAAGDLRLSLGDGAGQLGAPGPAIAGPTRDGASLFLHAIDLDGDAHVDLAAVAGLIWGGHAWASYRGDGLGGFTITPDTATGTTDAYTYDSCLGDLDGDGWTDLFISFQDLESTFSAGAQFLQGTGSSLVGDYPDTMKFTPLALKSVAMADLDGDGRGDLVGTPDDSDPELWLFRGAHNLHFAPGEVLPLAAFTNEVEVSDLDGNGVPDVLVSHALADSVSILRSTALPAGWSDLGDALPGAAGPPQLSGTGALLGGQAVQLQLTGAAPSAPVALVVGLSKLDAPFKGGVLVPDADVILVGLVTDAAGQLSLQAHWPAGVPAGFAAWMQAWIADAGGPKGFAASNGLGAKTAP